MKNSLLRAIIKKYLKLLLAMLVVASLGCGIMTGMANSVLSLQKTMDDYLEELNYPDAVVETKVTTRGVLEDILSVPGVEAADARLAGNLVMVTEDGVYYAMQAMTWSDEEFQGAYIWEESDEESEYPVLLEYRFAKLNDIHAGDPVEIRLQDRSWNCLVKAVISRPEMIALHKLGDMKLVSTDIGYIYIPTELLDKVSNPDYDSALSEWEENNQEFLKQKKDAKKEYDKVLGEIDDAEALLNEKKAELEKQIKTAGEKKAELLKYKEEIEKNLKELKEKEAELQEKKEQLEQSEAELQKAEAEVAAGKEEIRQKKELLDSTKSSLEATKAELQNQLGELDKKEEELRQTKEELQSAKNEIEKKLQELADKEKELNDTKEELLRKQAQLYQLKEAAASLKGLADSIIAFVLSAQEAKDPVEWARNAEAELQSILSEMTRVAQELEEISNDSEIMEFLESAGISADALNEEIAGLYTYYETIRNHGEELVRALEEGADSERIRGIFDALIQDCLEAWNYITSTFPISESEINELLGKIDAAIKEIEDALPQIEEGLNQIAEGRKLLLEKLEEVEGGLEQIEEGEGQLQAARTEITSGIAQIDEGLAQVAAGYEEIDRYTKQIQEAEEKIRSGRAELDEYYRQFLEGQKVLRETKDALLKSQKEIEDGLRTIDKKVADGKKKLKEGEDELTRNRNEANNQWLDYLKGFNDVEGELEAAKAELDEWDGYGVFCNQFLLNFEPDADPDRTLAEVEKVLGEDMIKDSYTYEDSPVKAKIDVNLEPLGIMSLFVPMLFFAVALIVEFLFMSFLIRLCRREIGILRALGFSRNSILALFCNVNAMTCAGAVILGMLIGFGVANYTESFFQNYFSLYFFEHTVDWGRTMISIAATFAVGQIATICSTRYISSIQPVEAMSRQASSAAVKSESRILSRMKVSPFFKYCILSLLRNKGRLIFSIICLASSVVLIFTSFSFDASKNRILSELFQDRIHYDCEIFMASEPDDAFLRRLSASGLVRDTEEVSYFTREIEGNGVTEERIIKAVSPDSELIGIYDSGRNPIGVSDEGILLEKHTADLMNVSAGDTVLVGGTPMRVSGICEECDDRYQYVSNDLADTLGEPDMCSVVCRVDKENEVPLMAFLSDEENYIYAAFTTKIYAGLEDGFQAFGVSALIILIFSVAVGSVIVINTIRTNLEEQKKDICVLRTLGFQYSSLSFRLFAQAAVYFVLSAIIGIPFGILVTKLTLKQLEISTRSYPFVNEFRIYLFTLLLVLAYIIVSHLISMRTVRKWNMVETVKDKE